jgi:hypothetical protein
MDLTYIVSAVRHRPENTDRPPKSIDRIGYSMIQLMRLAGPQATGVRANLQVNDSSALDELARYYANSRRLEWTFETGGGGGSLSVALRWTKFDRDTGSLQLVRTAVLRDLIGEAEQDPDDEPSPARKSESSNQVSPDSPDQTADQRPSPTQSRVPEGPTGSEAYSVREQVVNLWHHLVGRRGRVSPEGKTTS